MFLRNFWKILWTRYAQPTLKWSFINATFQLLKPYLELTIYRCKNNEHTPKYGNFNRKNDGSILSGGDFITIKPVKTY